MADTFISARTAGSYTMIDLRIVQMTEIRPAQAEDLPTLLAFEQKLIATERPMDPTLIQDRPISYYPLKDYITAKDTEVLVAVLGAEIVGSIYGQIRERQAFYQDRALGYIGFMYVRKANRGQGISQDLIKAITAWFREHNISEIQLKVYANNPRAIRAYEKVGFSPYLMDMRLDQPEGGCDD